MNFELKEKNILFISPKFFNYEKEIEKKIEDFGANVHYIDDRFDNGFIVKALLRLGIGKIFLKNKIIRYFLKELERSKFDKIDYVFALTPEAFSENVIEIYRKLLPDTVFILYMWDSFKNKTNTPHLLEYFDFKYSFDLVDSQNYDLNYLPLFYIDSYSSFIKKDNFLYDISFIGTAHSDRIAIAKKVVKQLGTNKYFFYFYFQSKILYYYNKIVNKHFKDVIKTDICFNSIDKILLNQVLENSKVVLDIQHFDQEGLTMRTFEMIGAKKKLITTNKNVALHDFYNSNNICILDRKKLEINSDFLVSDYIDLPKEIYEKYSLHSWIKTIFKL
jgi:hypothetical protein